MKNIISSSVEELLEAFGIKAKIKQEINIEFTSVRKKIVDTAFICEIDGQLYILHIEIQRGFSQDIVLRMVSYWVDIRMKHKIPVIQILIVFDFYEDVEGRFFEQTRYGGIDFRFQIINLSKAQNLKESRFAEIRILSVLNPDTDIGDIVDFLKQSNLPEEKFWELITKMYILSSVVGKEKEVERFMEDITIDLTKLRLFREAFEKTRKQAIEEGIEQGRKEGIEKGRKEGIEKG
ncbi:MAG: hypothetical protein N2254_05105, partial [bacterium]|nr:hypothetical protein [bacterium]